MPRNKEIDALRHNDTRKNIPTSELRDFAGDAEINPMTMRYPRDPSLDPQLVWNGKDEQDGEDLKVPTVPIYIQEKIQPLAIVQEVRRIGVQQAASELPQQMSLFGDFNGIEFEQLIEFYQHEQHWSNRMILGDALMVMTSLAEKEGMKGQVQMIYIDPPYGIKFGSNWQVSTRKRDVKDGREEDLVRQPEQIRAFRDTWEKGIHSYLSYLRDRLVVARDLLTESGSIFVQIGEENIHLVRSLLDEAFGSENIVRQITYVTTSFQADNQLANIVNYLLWYSKDKRLIKSRPLFRSKIIGTDEAAEYKWLLLPNGDVRSMTEAEIRGLETIPEGAKAWRHGPLTSQGYSPEGSKTVLINGRHFSPGGNQHWKTAPDNLFRLNRAGYLIERKNSLSHFMFLDFFPVSPITNVWQDTKWGFDASEKLYVVQTNAKIIERCLLMTTDPGDLVLDPTMGSATTAYVAEQWGRRWITIDTSRVALALARTRLMSARYPYYLLADSPEGSQKEMEVSGVIPQPRSYSNDVKQGFVYERVPHITLRDIANNEEIDTIYEQWQSYLEERRVWLNSTLSMAWEEWEVPRELPNPADEGAAQAIAEAQGVFNEYWQARRERQKQIDDSISRNSEREVLYDRPYEDRRKIRVSGSFTVESLSPHRILDPGYAETAARTDMESIGSYEQMVIDNLRIAGVQNTRREERLTFQTLEPFAGVWLHATGTYADGNGDERRAAVSIGSEHGTVGARQIKEAAKEAVKGIGYDLLLVCGFAFDAAASEESKRYGNLDVQIVRMNSDLMMGSVLKQTDRANLFTIFGEPDITIEEQPDGQFVVDVRGLDIYDPTTGQIRSSSTDDIACWFIDTAYNDESFFVRHAYFLGKEDAYDNLKRALRAEINEDAWQALYSTRSLPFVRPESGRIAVKVINHYGDEVLKVYNV